VVLFFLVDLNLLIEPTKVELATKVVLFFYYIQVSAIKNNLLHFLIFIFDV
jgi:hypothetical protein